MILFDINIFVDVLSARQGFDKSAQLIDLVEKGELEGVISSLTIPILWYITSQSIGFHDAKIIVEEIIKGFIIQALDEEIIRNSFKSEMKDFEDSIQYYSAKSYGCKSIITRNKRDFEGIDDIVIKSPEEFLEERNLKT
ncbi:MAG: type II toxin-antitoxin system VapC family toxin [Candidatus Hodarchaeota archaeon]